MKRFFAFLAAAIIVPAGLVGCEKSDQIMEPNLLPEAAQSFINTHFSSTTVRNVVKDYDDLTYTFEVALADGTQIEFKKSGEWKSIDNRQVGVPTSVLPEELVSYLTNNYAKAFIVDVERDWQYDVELNNGLDLDFTLGGKFIRIDH